jgi:Cu-Zn family superoxide dismutase
MRILSAIAISLALSSAAFAQMGTMTPLPSYTVDGARPAAAASADIVNQSGQTIGSAIFYQGPAGVLIDIAVRGLTPGKHGVHFHWVGVCEGSDKFASAQHHMGLKDGPHGFLQPKGPHAGDLPNIIIAADGTGAAQFYTDMVRIFAAGKKNRRSADLMDADGSSLIIHEKEDDDFTQPSGGAGGRIACGVIKRL